MTRESSEHERRVLYRGRIVTLALEDEKWEVVLHAPAVAVLAFEEGKMLCVRQYRHGPGRMTLEVPAGLIDPGESPEAAALRELAEEAGLSGRVEKLSGFYASPGFCDEFIHLFRVRDLRPGEGTRDEDEQDIESVWIAPEKLLADVRSGALFSSSPTIALALFAMLEQLNTNEKTSI